MLHCTTLTARAEWCSDAIMTIEGFAPRVLSPEEFSSLSKADKSKHLRQRRQLFWELKGKHKYIGRNSYFQRHSFKWKQIQFVQFENSFPRTVEEEMAEPVESKFGYGEPLSVRQKMYAICWSDEFDLEEYLFEIPKEHLVESLWVFLRFHFIRETNWNHVHLEDVPSWLKMLHKEGKLSDMDYQSLQLWTVDHLMMRGGYVHEDYSFDLKDLKTFIEECEYEIPIEYLHAFHEDVLEYMDTHCQGHTVGMCFRNDCLRLLDEKLEACFR